MVLKTEHLCSMSIQLQTYDVFWCFDLRKKKSTDETELRKLQAQAKQALEPLPFGVIRPRPLRGSIVFLAGPSRGLAPAAGDRLARAHLPPPPSLLGTRFHLLPLHKYEVFPTPRVITPCVSPAQGRSPRTRRSSGETPPPKMAGIVTVCPTLDQSGPDMRRRKSRRERLDGWVSEG